MIAYDIKEKLTQVRDSSKAKNVYGFLPCSIINPFEGFKTKYPQSICLQLSYCFSVDILHIRQFNNFGISSQWSKNWKMEGNFAWRQCCYFRKKITKNLTSCGAYDFVKVWKAGILLFSLNFIGLLLINGSGEYLSLLIKNWRSYRTKDKSWATIYNEFWKCMPFKLVMPFETEFLYVQSRQSKPSLTSPTYYLALLTEVLVPILLPFGSFTFAIFLTIGSYGCSG